MSEREKFEAYFKDKYPELYKDVFDEDGDDRAIIGYSFAWSAWQAVKADFVPKWISVNDRMPEKGQLIIGRYAGGSMDGQVEVVQIDGSENPGTVFFSHWIPMPVID